MKFSEEQVKEIVALREDLMRQVDKHQEGIEMLEKNIAVLDGFLKDSSFVKASKLDTKIESKEEIKISNPEEKSKPVENSIKKMSRRKSIFVVHAHGDNIEKLRMVKKFKNCIGTTQTEPFNKIQNFGGFTDGDRGVFLASHFNAKKIILFGMDFGTRIGKFSNTKKSDRKIKLKKLKIGEELLIWLSSITKSELFTTSMPIKGFKKIPYKDLDIIIT